MARGKAMALQGHIPGSTPDVASIFCLYFSFPDFLPTDLRFQLTAKKNGRSLAERANRFGTRAQDCETLHFDSIGGRCRSSLLKQQSKGE